MARGVRRWFAAACVFVGLVASPAPAGAAIEFERSVAGVRLGMPEPEVRGLLGEAFEARRYAGLFDIYTWPARRLDVTFGRRSRRATVILTQDPNEVGPRGVRVGISERTLRERLALRCQAGSELTFRARRVCFRPKDVNAPRSTVFGIRDGKVVSAGVIGAPVGDDTAPTPVPDGGYTGPPQHDPTCSGPGTATASPVEAVSACFARRSGVFVSETWTRVNGVDLTPLRSGVEIRVDPRRARISTNGPVDVHLGPFGLYRGAIDWPVRGLAAFKAEPQRKGDRERGGIGGLAIEGTVELDFKPGTTSLKLGVTLPKVLDGLGGEAKASASNEHGLRLDEAKVKAGGARVGPWELRNVSLTLSRGDTGAYHFDGDATVYPFPGRPLGIRAGIGFGPADGYFRLVGGVDGLNRPLVSYAILLQRLTFTLSVNPFELAGEVGISGGPQVKLPGKAPFEIASSDGGYRLTFPKPWIWKVEKTGKLTIASTLELLNTSEALYADGRWEASGDVTWNPPVVDYGIEGRFGGWIDLRQGISFEGSIRLKLPGPDALGEGVISDNGIAGCRRGFGPDFGFGYRWGERAPTVMAGGCGLGPWRGESEPASVAQARRGFRLPRGQRVAAFSAIGTSAAPKVTLSGPLGLTVATPPAPDGQISDSRFFLFQDQAARTTYIAVANPPAGRWTLQPQPGSDPVTTYRSSRSLPALRLRARVRGRGHRRVLSFRASGLSGRRLTFLEEGNGARRVLGRTARSRGALRFRPAPGPAGRRRIVALVFNRGLQDGRRTVARYRAPAAARAPRPRRLRVRGRHLRRIVTWRGPRGVRYRVSVRLSDGRRLLYLPRGRRVTVRPVVRGTRMSVTVRAYDELGRPGPAARGRFR